MNIGRIMRSILSLNFSTRNEFECRPWRNGICSTNGVDVEVEPVECALEMICWQAGHSSERKEVVVATWRHHPANEMTHRRSFFRCFNHHQYSCVRGNKMEIIEEDDKLPSITGWLAG